MKKGIIIFSALVLLFFFIGNGFIKKPEKEGLENTRKEIYKNRMLMFCTPDWSVLNTDSLGQSIGPLTGWGNYHWDIRSGSDSAQFYFDQGINMYFGFHLIESMASFKKAASFDSENPMIYWGQALAYGPNINDIEYAATPDALAAARKAKSLLAFADSTGQALINAMQVRYSPDSTTSRKKLNQLYADAMKKVYNKLGHLPDVSTLYADALMLLHPWMYWKGNGQPEAWTPEIVSVLEKTLSTHPNHPGANHYYIHMVEASNNPALGLASADRLPNLMPAVSHMVHMPSHIYIRTGHYQKGVNVNDQAVGGYQQYLSMYPNVAENLPLYLVHNLHMKAACAMMMPSYSFSLQAAKECAGSFDTAFLSLPAPLGNFIQYVHLVPLMVQVRYEQWNDLLAYPVPEKTHIFSTALYHWGRGMALANTKDIPAAKSSLQTLRKWMKHPDMQVILNPFNKPVDQIRTGELILQGTIFEKEQKVKEALSVYQQAVVAEDKLVYTEPRDWLLPARYYLGRCQFANGQLAAAEKTIREELGINPNNHHSLTLLQDIYTRMGNKEAELEKIGRSMKEAAY